MFEEAEFELGVHYLVSEQFSKGWKKATHKIKLNTANRKGFKL